MYRQGWDTGGWDADWERVRNMDPEGVEKVGILFQSFLFSSHVWLRSCRTVQGSLGWVLISTLVLDRDLLPCICPRTYVTIEQSLLGSHEITISV
jgi:hypothetical protein